MTADDKDYVLKKDNLTQTIQMQLTQKQKPIYEFFFSVLKSLLNFKHFAETDDTHSWRICEITGSEKQG